MARLRGRESQKESGPGNTHGCVYVRANDDATVRVTRLKPLTPIDRTI